MASFVWERSSSEAYENPYEYDAQGQFAQEADDVLRRLHSLLLTQHKYSKEERTPSKAIWMLHVDACDALRSGLEALERKEHRLTGRIFRDVVEVLDLAFLFASGSEEGEIALKRWFRGEFVGHRESREHLKVTQGQAVFEARRELYKSLSRFTHRTYEALLEGYSLGAEKRLVHDGIGEAMSGDPQLQKAMVLPETISAYYANLAGLVLFFTQSVAHHRLISAQQVKEAYETSLQEHVVPRRFMTREMMVRMLEDCEKEVGSHHSDSKSENS